MCAGSPASQQRSNQPPELSLFLSLSVCLDERQPLRHVGAGDPLFHQAGRATGRGISRRGAAAAGRHRRGIARASSPWPAEAVMMGARRPTPGHSRRPPRHHRRRGVHSAHQLLRPPS
jgi:hypothetical protein